MQIVNFFKRFWLIFSLAVVAASLSFLWFIIRTGEPGKKEAPPKPAPTFQKIDFPSLSAPGEEVNISFLIPKNFEGQLTKTLPVWRAKFFPKSQTQDMLFPVILDLGFTSQPQERATKDGLFLIWKENENIFLANAKTAQFSFSGKARIFSSVSGQNVGLLIRQKLQGWGVDFEITEEEVKGYVQAGDELEPAKNLSLSDVFIASFAAQINGYPTIGVEPSGPLVEAKVDNEGNLLSLSFSLLQRGEKEVLPVKPLSRVMDGFKNQAKIYSFKDNQGNPIPITLDTEFKSISIDSLQVVYPESFNPQEFIFPAFQFLGSVTTTGGKTGAVELLVPAVEGFSF